MYLVAPEGCIVLALRCEQIPGVVRYSPGYIPELVRILGSGTLH